MTETHLDQLNRMLTGTTHLGKREIVRRAIDIVERQDTQIQNQTGSINRLLERWNDIGAFLVGMQDIFTERKDAQGLIVVRAILKEMERLETGES
jgi:hypothetical protein